MISLHLVLNGCGCILGFYLWILSEIHILIFFLQSLFLSFDCLPFERHFSAIFLHLNFISILLFKMKIQGVIRIVYITSFLTYNPFSMLSQKTILLSALCNLLESNFQPNLASWLHFPSLVGIMMQFWKKGLGKSEKSKDFFKPS